MTSAKPGAGVPKRPLPLAVSLAAVALALAGVSRAAPRAVHEAYWWLDEVRAAAFAISTARSGRVAQWPRMAVPLGSATLPLPRANSPIVLNGKLDDQAWSQATAFPAGPVFGPWRTGPFMLKAYACHDDENLYLALVSPVDLTDLGSLGPRGELFTVDRPYRAGKGGGIPSRGVTRTRSYHTIELSVPLPKRGNVALAFTPEVVRQPGGKLPHELALLGLGRGGADRRRGRRRIPAWLGPFQVTLVPADTWVRLDAVVLEGRAHLLGHLFVVDNRTNFSGTAELDPVPHSSLCRLAYKHQHKGRLFTYDGFVPRAPIAETLSTARALIGRGASMGVARERVGKLLAAADGLESEARRPRVPDSPAWRALYCQARELRARAHLAMLDAPLLFTKRHPYFAGHIYDDYYTWHPGGGIYVLENPHEVGAASKVRTLIDATTKPTLGPGVYRDPELSWDAKRVVFANKAASNAWTSLYEMGVDGKGLRRLTNPQGYHDITPAYLPDGDIVFTSTRPRHRVPCFNSGVDTLHRMTPDGKTIWSISSNNVTEFDPAILHDGRILYGRWEYLDKTALYMQSLWTMFPDGTNETALFANNMARPTAVLDARPVPGTHLVVAALTPHNGQARGAIGLIDPHRGKNGLQAVTNLTPEYPAAMDQGLRVGPADPWPLSRDDVLIANNALGAHGVIELVDRFGHRELAHADPALSCSSPMLVKPRPRPPVISPQGPVAKPAQDPASGRFLVLDVYQGLRGVPRGEVKQLRVVEETARVSEVPPGGRWWNQAFLVSWQGPYVIKNYLGVVPVHPDGSAYFEAPAGRALYFQALDAEGRELQRMRTYVQAVPGVTRSCIGCHEHKYATPAQPAEPAQALLGPPAKPKSEPWGSGFVDYPTMVQPILDKHCVSCHGGEKDIAGGLDLSGGWTWAFNISYESLLKKNLAGFVRCHNSDVTSSVILAPRTIGSAVAPLANVLSDGHEDRIPKITDAERRLIHAWMDTDSCYYGTWNYTKHATCRAILGTAGPLAGTMRAAGCAKCHAAGHVGNDWVNLQTPEWSRILRAPLAKSEGGLGLAWCRQRKASRGFPLVTQRQMPPDVFRPPKLQKPDRNGDPVVTFASAKDPRYQAMLATIRRARADALARARVDMPGADVVPGVCRHQYPVPLPKALPTLTAAAMPDESALLTWTRSAETIGLTFELHRSPTEGFTPTDKTRIGESLIFRHVDPAPPPGPQHYALIVLSDDARSQPVRAAVTVPQPAPPPAPVGLKALAQPGQVILTWQPGPKAGLRYDVYRAPAGATPLKKITAEPVPALSYSDTDLVADVEHVYRVRAVTRRGQESPASAPVTSAALREVKEPVFTVDFAKGPVATLLDGSKVKGLRHGGAVAAGQFLDLGKGGHVTFPHRPELDLTPRLSIECWLHQDRGATMPVVLSCGSWQDSGWFLQCYQGRWRWYVGGMNCDGGRVAFGRWVHLVCTFDGRRARLFEDGKLVAQTASAAPNLTPYPGRLHVGQYSAGPNASFQVTGRVAGVKLYRRAVPSAEAAAAFTAGPPR